MASGEFEKFGFELQVSRGLEELIPYGGFRAAGADDKEVGHMDSLSKSFIKIYRKLHGSLLTLLAGRAH